MHLPIPIQEDTVFSFVFPTGEMSWFLCEAPEKDVYWGETDGTFPVFRPRFSARSLNKRSNRAWAGMLLPTRPPDSPLHSHFGNPAAFLSIFSCFCLHQSLQSNHKAAFADFATNRRLS